MDRQQLIAELGKARQRLNVVLSRVDERQEIYPTAIIHCPLGEQDHHPTVS